MKRTFFQPLTFFFALVLASSLSYTTALAEDGDDFYDDDFEKVLKVELVPQAQQFVDMGSTGVVKVINKDFGPDVLVLHARNLPPETSFSVFLAHSPVAGQFPSHFIGEFSSNRAGKAKLVLRTEVIEAYANTNVDAVLPDGTTGDTPGVGAIANGAITIPMNWIRIYVGLGTGNVFGVSGGLPGAAHVFSTAEPFPTDESINPHL